ARAGALRAAVRAGSAARARVQAVSLSRASRRPSSRVPDPPPPRGRSAPPPHAPGPLWQRGDRGVRGGDLVGVGGAWVILTFDFELRITNYWFWLSSGSTIAEPRIIQSKIQNPKFQNSKLVIRNS